MKIIRFAYDDDRRRCCPASLMIKDQRTTAWDEPTLLFPSLPVIHPDPRLTTTPSAEDAPHAIRPKVKCINCPELLFLLLLIANVCPIPAT